MRVYVTIIHLSHILGIFMRFCVLRYALVYAHFSQLPIGWYK